MAVAGEAVTAIFILRGNMHAGGPRHPMMWKKRKPGIWSLREVRAELTDITGIRFVVFPSVV
jgi:hypothetical protein